VEQMPLVELCRRYRIDTKRVYKWQRQFFHNGAAAFKVAKRQSQPVDQRRDGALQKANLKVCDQVRCERIGEHAIAASSLAAQLGLTHREGEVLYWLSEGKANAEIAILVGARARTIGKHLEHLFVKLGVESRTAAAATALRALFGL